MVVELEKGRYCDRQVVQYEKAIQELTVQISELQKQVSAMSAKFDEATKQMETERRIAEEKDKARVEEIKAAGKTKWGQVFGSLAAGAAIVGVLLLVL